MHLWSVRIASLLWPELKELPLPRQLVGVGDVLTSIYSTALYLVGFLWLFRVSDFELIWREGPTFLILAGFIQLFSYLSFFMIIEFREDRYGSTDGAFNSMMVWAAVFLFGPTALWLIVILKIIEFILQHAKAETIGGRWNSYRNLSLTLAGFTIPYLMGLKVFESMGGSYPIPVLNFPMVLAATISIAINFILFILIWTPYFLYALRTQRILAAGTDSRPIITFFVLALSLPTVAHPFAILAAGLYSQSGLFTFLFFMTGLVVVAYLARQFSKIAESSRQQSRQLEKLELLGRAILNAPSDGSTLAEILKEHISNMFPSGNMAIWTIPGQTLYKSPEDWNPDFKPIWDWVSNTTESCAFPESRKLPWPTTEHSHRPTVCTPIIAFEGTEVIGGIHLELHTLAHPWDMPAMKKLFPAIQTLAGQIASAIHQAEEYANSLALQKVGQELQIAGQIQASFLPNKFPNIPGWQLAVTLEPAGGLSGDFFDFIPLSRGRYGIMIADVADKGLGAALYMALCRTLLRTYAFEYHSRPDIVFNETNDRVLLDARANLFITCFYGVLDPVKDTLTYCNAGHNPPYLFTSSNGSEPLALTRTGMPIGIEPDTRWERKTIEFSPGDKLVLYTDGVTEAQNNDGEFFDDDLLIKSVQENVASSAYEVQTNILNNVHTFIDGAPQFDDITLMVIAKETETIHNPEKE